MWQSVTGSQVSLSLSGVWACNVFSVISTRSSGKYNNNDNERSNQNNNNNNRREQRQTVFRCASPILSAERFTIFTTQRNIHR